LTPLSFAIIYVPLVEYDLRLALAPFELRNVGGDNTISSEDVCRTRPTVPAMPLPLTSPFLQQSIYKTVAAQWPTQWGCLQHPRPGPKVGGQGACSIPPSGGVEPRGLHHAVGGRGPRGGRHPGDAEVAAGCRAHRPGPAQPPGRRRGPHLGPCKESVFAWCDGLAGPL